MEVYIYDADVYCKECGEAICQEINDAGNAPADIDDQTSYDSGEYPKLCSDIGESDCPQHCGCGEDCLNAYEVADDWKIGVWLENDLTTDGVEYVREACQESNPVTEYWRTIFDAYDISLSEV